MNYFDAKIRIQSKRLFTPENAKILQSRLQGKDSALKADLIRFYSVMDAIMHATDVAVDDPISSANPEQNQSHPFEYNNFQKIFVSNDLENIIKNMYTKNDFLKYKSYKK